MYPAHSVCRWLAAHGVCRIAFVMGQSLIKDNLGVFWGLSTTVSGQMAWESGGDADTTFGILRTYDEGQAAGTGKLSPDRSWPCSQGIFARRLP
jgi:hypothetical protein